MNEDELESVMNAMLADAAIEVSNKANMIQMNVDAFYEVQAQGLTESEIAALVRGGGTTPSTVIEAEVQAFFNWSKGAFRGHVNLGAQEGVAVVQRDSPGDRLYTWTVNSQKPCPDCADRSGEQRSYDEWQAAGLPRSGITLCGHSCLCVLVEEEFSKTADKVKIE